MLSLSLISGRSRPMSWAASMPQQVPDVVAVLDLRKKPPDELGSKHAWIELQNGPSKAETVCHQVDLLLDVVFLLCVQPDVLRGIFKVTEDLRKRQSAHLVVEPLVVEENIVVEIFVPEASDQLEGELGELAEVVPRQLALLVVVSKGHRRHLPVLVVVFALQVEGVLLDLGVAEGLQDSTP